MNKLLLVLIYLALFVSGGFAEVLVFDVSFSVKPRPGTRFIVQLYGNNKYVADAPASLLRTFYKKMSRQQETIELAVEPDLHLDIDQGFGITKIENTSYYFVVYIDIDGDGRVCKGDLRQDYDATGGPFFISNLAEVHFDVPMVVKKSKHCDIK